MAPKTRGQRFISKLSGQVHLLAYDLTPTRLDEYIDVIRRSQAKYIIGYANNIYHLARLLLERGEELRLDAVFTTAERLLPSWADAMRKALDCKVYSYYGCGESNSLGYQCQEGQAYHISEEHVILEVEGKKEKNNSPARGSLLITDLDNYAMPLIRYENGDCLTLGDQPCGCGRSLKLISKVEGRTYEFLLGTSRELVSAGICDVILGNVTSVAEFQVRQDAADHILVLVVPCRGITDEDTAFIRRSFRHYLGESMAIEIRLVDSIPRSKAQKLQTAINELL